MEPHRPPDSAKGAPNVLLVLIDDAGFGNPSTFGGPIQTPNYTRVAEGGLRYNRFHVTALCSPTRAALLTGRNNHTVGFGSIGEFRGRVPGLLRDVATELRGAASDPAGQRLQHGRVREVAPDARRTARSGRPLRSMAERLGLRLLLRDPRRRLESWDPVLAENQKIIGTPDEYYDAEHPYYFPDAMADRTITWLHGVHAQDAHKPFFVYYSTGCSHAPHHVAREWADKYKGKFDQGWDVLREETFARQKELGVIPADAELTPRDAAFPAWDDVPEKLKRFYARQMEVYAGYSENADHNVGRVIDAIAELGELDNTLIVWIWGDNGASMEGTITGSFNELTMQNGIPLTDDMQARALGALRRTRRVGVGDHGSSLRRGVGVGGQHAVQVGQAGRFAPRRDAQPVGRAVARPHPRRRWAAFPVHPRHRRGAHDPRRRRDPGRLRRSTGSNRSRCTVPRSPRRSTSADAPEHRTQQYFETVGNRGMYKDGWWLAMKTERIPWVAHTRSPRALRARASGIRMPAPPSSTTSPTTSPRRTTSRRSIRRRSQELKELFWEEAEKYKVLPLLATFSTFFGILPPDLGRDRRSTFHGDVQNVMPGMIPRLYNRSYTITADLVVPERRRRRGHRRRGRPPGRVHAVRQGREAHPHLFDDGRVHLHPGRRGGPPDRQRDRAHGVRSRRVHAGDRRRGDALHR